MVNLEGRHRYKGLGTTLVEVLITTGVFSAVMVVLFTMVQYGLDSWRSVEGRHVTQSMMRKVSIFALDDIRRTCFSKMGVAAYSNYTASDNSTPGYSAWAGGTDITDKIHYGQALWMLSAYKSNPEGDNPGGAAYFGRDSTGRPSWKTNILYYAAVLSPEDHKARYGYEVGTGICKSASTCPHKWLIRREIDTGALLSASDIKSFLVSPDKVFSSTSASVGGTTVKVLKSQILADCIVAFRVVTNKPNVTLVVKSARLEELTRSLNKRGMTLQDRAETNAVSQGSLSNEEALSGLNDTNNSDVGAYTLQYDIVAVPQNEEE